MAHQHHGRIIKVKPNSTLILTSQRPSLGIRSVQQKAPSGLQEPFTAQRDAPVAPSIPVDVCLHFPKYWVGSAPSFFGKPAFTFPTTFHAPTRALALRDSQHHASRKHAQWLFACVLGFIIGRFTASGDQARVKALSGLHVYANVSSNYLH